MSTVKTLVGLMNLGIPLEVADCQMVITEDITNPSVADDHSDWSILHYAACMELFKKALVTNQVVLPMPISYPRIPSHFCCSIMSKLPKPSWIHLPTDCNVNYVSFV